MKMVGIYKAATLTLLLTWACAAVMSGCRSDQGTDESSEGAVGVPHGYMARLEQVHDGRMIGFGPFVGYYFRPEDPGDHSGHSRKGGIVFTGRDSVLLPG